MNENIDTKIRDYAAGALAGNALREFEQRLKNEPELQADLDLYLTLKAADNLRLKKQLLQTAEAEQLAPVSPPRALVRRLPLLMAAVASMVLLLIAVWWWRRPAGTGADQLAQSYIAAAYPPPVVAMGDADNRPAALQRAFLAYRTGDFVAAAQQLTELSAPADASDETLFYAGEALLQTGQWQGAIDHFNRVRPGYWQEAAEWRCALALIKSGQTARARGLLEKLRSSPRQSQAEALIKALQ